MSRTTISMSGPADEVLAEVVFRVASNLVEAEVNCKAVADQLEARGVELVYKDGDAVAALRSLAVQIHSPNSVIIRLVSAVFADKSVVLLITISFFGMPAFWTGLGRISRVKGNDLAAV